VVDHPGCSSPLIAVHAWLVTYHPHRVNKAERTAWRWHHRRTVQSGRRTMQPAVETPSTLLRWFACSGVAPTALQEYCGSYARAPRSQVGIICARYGAAQDGGWCVNDCVHIACHEPVSSFASYGRGEVVCVVVSASIRHPHSLRRGMTRRLSLVTPYSLA